MIKFSQRFFAAAFILLSLPVLAQLTPTQLAQGAKYHSAKLSPDGKYIAVVLVQDGSRKMVVLDSKTFEMKGATAFSGKEQVGSIHWVNNERIVIHVMHKRGWLEELHYYGELFAVNFDGTRTKMIYGYRNNDTSTGTYIKKRKATLGWAYIIDYLPEDDKHILIESRPMSDGGEKLSTVHKLNVYSGLMSNALAKSPIPYPNFYTDQDSNLRLVMGTDNENIDRAYKFIPDGRTWEEIPNEDFGTAFTPLRFNKKGDWLYIIDNHNQDKDGLFKLNVDTGERKHLYTDEDVDISNAVFSADNNKVYAVRVDPGYPAYVVFNSSSDESKTFKALIKTFAGHRVSITSQSKDGNKMVLSVSSDINPSAFYFYDKVSNKLSMLFSNLGKLDQNQLAVAEPISFKARDGVTIHGYLSRPVTAKPDVKIPLVTLVHGGPHGVRDTWLYDSQVQMLANQGYAVLRVNFRGSGGYGKAHEKAGYKHWGDLAQYDIIDGTKWAIENQNIAANKVCIMGGSFGGYSAVQSATLEPDLFKCVVANAGVYDLEMMYEAGDIPQRGWGKSYLEMAVGSDKTKLREFSPVNHVGKLKAAIMVAHGERDERVPFEQAEKLADNLKKAGKDYHWFTRSTETHGFYNEENRAAYFQEVADFLKKHLQ